MVKVWRAGAGTKMVKVPARCKLHPCTIRLSSIDYPYTLHTGCGRLLTQVCAKFHMKQAAHALTPPHPPYSSD